MNKTELIGNVTKDIELYTSNSGKSNCNFSLAVRRKYSDADGNEIVDFHNCVAFGKLAETLNKYVRKGNELYVCGELIYDNYTNRDGVKKIVTKIIVDTVEFLTPKVAEGVEASSSTQSELTPIEDDSLPF